MKTLKFGIVLFFATSFLHAQGCSDAGICSIGKAFQEETKTFKNSFEINSILGQADGNVSIFTQTLSYTRKFTDKFSLGSRVTFNLANGNFGTSNGVFCWVGNFLSQQPMQRLTIFHCQWIIKRVWELLICFLVQI